MCAGHICILNLIGNKHPTVLVNLFVKGDFYYAECYLRVTQTDIPKQIISLYIHPLKLLKSMQKNHFLKGSQGMREQGPYLTFQVWRFVHILVSETKFTWTGFVHYVCSYGRDIS